MKLFGFGNKNKVRNQTSGQGAEWQMEGVKFAGEQTQNRITGGGEMVESEAERQERLTGERQRRKITAAIFAGMEDQSSNRQRRMAEIISTHDVNVGQEQYETMIEMMASGVVGKRHGREVISMIQRPADKYGSQEIFRRMDTIDTQRDNVEEVKHMKRILGNFSSAGFRGYRETSARSIDEFLQRFPDAMSFDEASEDFLDSINNRKNPPETIRSYHESMKRFKALMYGNEQKYLDQFKVMERQAMERRREWGVKGQGRGNEAASEQKRTVASERELQREQLVTSFAEKQVARGTVRENGGTLRRRDLLRAGEQKRTRHEIDSMLESEASEDACVSLPERGVFGLFDGAGGEKNGRAASRMARDAFIEGRPDATRNSVQLAQMMETMNRKVCETGGITTGVVAKVNMDQNGRKYLSYASVGDSRLYILHRNGQISLETRDEGERNRVWNMLGMRKDQMEFARIQMGVQDRENVCLQHNDVWLSEGDRVIMCSDGISGDNPPENGKPGDLLSDGEIKFLADRSKAPTAEDAAENLLVGAKKIDDRSVIVFDV